MIVIRNKKHEDEFTMTVLHLNAVMSDYRSVQ